MRVTIINSGGVQPVVVNNPNVGANLICQYGPNAIFSGVTNAQPFLQGTINCSGVVTSGFNYPNVDTRVVQLVALQAVPPNPSVPTGLAQSIGFILQPSSRGSVQIVSKSPLVQPNVDLNMYSDGPVTTLNTDANKAVASLYLVEQAVVGGGGFMVYPTSDQFTMGPAALLQAAQASSGISIADHICGTTRMGASSATAVVDANLNVFGVKNLMIADLGVAPISPDGNTCYAVYMIGLNAARILGIDVPPAL